MAGYGGGYGKDGYDISGYRGGGYGKSGYQRGRGYDKGACGGGYGIGGY